MPLSSPISNGSLLDNRYEVSQFLGYGGFGRTYLARDRQRFNESCVLKEFAPQINSPEILRKAEELFQREAGTLYQLRHEQIPEFRAQLSLKIEGHDVLMIVEQYVAGQTYEQWIEGGDRLDETGAIQFLRDLLPVLMYIHTRGVVHRDISPDNLIREKNSLKPFLIDFGSVRQVAKTAMQMSGVATGTQIYKPGFSPREQLRGEVSPSTDLYSLAVTTLVLVTGRSPLELYDDQSDHWHWRQFVRFNPTLEQLLDHMLATKVSDRARSASDVMQRLQTISGLPGLAVGDLAPYIPPRSVAFPSAPPHTLAPLLQSPLAQPQLQPKPPLQSLPQSQPQSRPQSLPQSQMRTVAIAPAHSPSFPTTYPPQLQPKEADRPGSLILPDRHPGRDLPEDHGAWMWVKLPWKMLVWCLKGLWMGVKAIDWVLTWIWRGFLIAMLVAGGAVASYLWKTGQTQVAAVEEQVRSPQIQIPKINLPQIPQLELPQITLPEMKVPDFKLPTWNGAKPTSFKNCAETIARFERSGLSRKQFYGAVDKKFRLKHPELDGRDLGNLDGDASLRQEWCSIGDQVLNDAQR